jgi:ElaB/YqjD/DUF883 family membrane-anchored ribosome-binding protein
MARQRARNGLLSCSDVDAALVRCGDKVSAINFQHRSAPMAEMSNMTAAQREKLMSDLRTVVADAEQLLKMTADEVGEGAAGLRQRLQERLAQSKQRMLDLQHAAADKAKAVGYAADDYVHDHPWKSVAIGAGIGVIVGMLISRR